MASKKSAETQATKAEPKTRERVITLIRACSGTLATDSTNRVQAISNVEGWTFEPSDRGHIAMHRDGRVLEIVNVPVMVEWAFPPEEDS